jgi:GT2 family glycosyltransferase
VILRDRDEVIVADNRAAAPGEEPVRPAEATSPRVIPAGAMRSPGFARNRAAAAASGEWLVMIDADTEPDPALLDAYFAEPPSPRTAILAGAIEDRAGAATLAARHAAARGQMDQALTIGRGRFAYAQTANCAIRRDAFTRSGGFAEDARAGEDADLCLRLIAAGWQLQPRPGARVVHRTRADTRALLAQLARHGAGAAWCERRHPGSFPPPRPHRFMARLAGDAARALGAAARGDREAAREHLLELAEACAFEGGRLLPNNVRRRGPTG